MLTGILTTNKKNRNLTNNCQEGKKKKKVFWGRGAYRNAVAQGPLVILRRPCLWMCNGTSRWGQAFAIDAWQCFLFDIRDCIKEWLLCFYCPSLSPSLLTGLWDVECVSVVLFCYIGCCVVLCVKKLKNVDNKKKRNMDKCL